jgi:hypothetical protein
MISLLLGVILIVCVIKLLQFSIKWILALVFCLGISCGFWKNYEDKIVTVTGDTTITLNFPATSVKSMATVKIWRKNNQVEVSFDRLPNDGLFVAINHNEPKFFQMTHSGGKITNVTELEKPVGWMTILRKEKP